MKIVLDNIIFSLQTAGGISAYWFELVRRMARDNLDCAYLEYRSSVRNIFRKELALNPSSLIQNRWLPISIARYLPFAAGSNNATVHHSSYYRVPFSRRSTCITTVHDFTYERFYRGSQKSIHTRQKGFAIRRADGIICVSHSTKRDLLEFYPEIPERNIRVIYHGVSDHIVRIDCARNPLPQNVCAKPFILFVGSRPSYKNFTVAMEVVASLPNYRFVSAGGGPLGSDHLAFSRRHLRNRHTHLSYVDNSLLNRLYNHAFAFICPSSYEGFGIPIIEAMTVGCPVIALNSSAIPEACGDAAILVNDLRAEAFANAITKLESPNFRNDLIKKGHIQSKRFSWENCYSDTLSFYYQISETSASS